MRDCLVGRGEDRGLPVGLSRGECGVLEGLGAILVWCGSVVGDGWWYSMQSCCCLVVVRWI
jgi:hypothetical protein